MKLGAALVLTLCLIPVLASAQEPPAAPQSAPPPQPTGAAPEGPAPADTRAPDSPYYVPPATPDYTEWAARNAGKKRRSTGMMIGGAIVSGLGGLGFLGGVVNYLAAGSYCGTLGTSGLSSSTCVDTYRVAGVVGMVTGGLMMAIGIPLAVVGAAKVPGEANAAMPELRIGAGQASLRWTF